MDKEIRDFLIQVMLEPMDAKKIQERARELLRPTPPGKIPTAEALVYSWNWQQYQGGLLSEINEMMNAADIPTERYFHDGLQTYIVTDRVKILIQKYQRLAEQAKGKLVREL